MSGENLLVLLNGAQPAEWVEDRRVRLTPFEAERGITPAKMTPLEWRRMNDASRAHSDAALHRSLQRALLGP